MKINEYEVGMSSDSLHNIIFNSIYNISMKKQTFYSSYTFLMIKSCSFFGLTCIF